jgi:nitroreductase
MPPSITDFSASRFSPHRFEEAHEVTDDVLDSLLEAARLAPSAGNSQPWAFIVGRRGDETHRRMIPHLAGSSSTWAPQASALIANLSQHLVEGSLMTYSEFADYDLGQAVAHLTFQAHSLGLAVHQFRAFDREAIAREFEVPPHWQVTSLAAVGLPAGDAESHPEVGANRSRRSLTSVTWARSVDARTDLA